MSSPAFFIGSRWRNARLFPRTFLGTNTDVWHKMCICVFTGCQDEARLYLMSLQPFIIRMGSNLSLENFFISLSAPDLHSAQETKTGSNVWKEVPETRSLGPPNHHTWVYSHEQLPEDEMWSSCKHGARPGLSLPPMQLPLSEHGLLHWLLHDNTLIFWTENYFSSEIDWSRRNI